MTLEETLAPSVAVLALWAIIALLVPKTSRAAPWLIAGMCVLTLAYYLPWRFTETVLPADPLSGGGLYIWFIFFIELIYIADFAKLCFVHLKRVDRHADADAHQAALEARPEDAWPGVDVMIPTYNEPLDVLERTIVGALALDYPNFKVWVLDDGDRDWLRDYCAEKGAGYIRRDDHAHAKAGNLNNALGETKGELIAVLDADFVPLRQFLKRTVGFFREPGIGIVQTPQHFFNRDPMQINLGLSDRWPDEQRLFFDRIAPALDAWNAMFSCGSCAVLRRQAITDIGGIPTVSVTEDILTSLTLLRHGYVTRYLNERLTIGLAPESLEAFYIQRHRWCRGGIQCLFTAAGPLGPGLDFAKRVLTFPAYWLLLLPARLIVLLIPILYFWLGLDPLFETRSRDLIFWQLPFVVSSYAAAIWYYGRQLTPLAHDGPAILISLNLLPTILSSLIKPFGAPFRVTPKGTSAKKESLFRWDLAAVLVLLALTIGGMAVNIPNDYRIVEDDGLLGIGHLWAIFNSLALIVAALACVDETINRKQERFPVNFSAVLETEGGRIEAAVRDMSLSGARLIRPASDDAALAEGDAVTLHVPGLGPFPARIARIRRRRLGLELMPVNGPQRDALIRFLYTSGIENDAEAGSISEVASGLFERFTEERTLR